MMEKMKFETKDLTQENIAKIGQLFPEVLTEAKDDIGTLKKAIDFDKLRQILSDSAIDNRETYDFTWVGKKQAILEAATPIRKTLRPCKEESVNWDTTQNLYIEGDNLDVLKLLQESYLGKVKMIYIDPPYNTGKDFIYKDGSVLSQEEYEKLGERLDEEGNRLIKNTDSNGRFHSDWCSMIYSRLKLARNLLTDDGVIFISIDDNEMGNLRKICDEVFNASNRLDRGCAVWLNKGSTKGFHKIVKNHEYIFAYARNTEKVQSVFGKNFPHLLKDIEERVYIKRSSKNPLCQIRFPKGLKIEGVQNITFQGTLGGESTNRLDIISGKMVFKDGILQNDVILEGSFPYRYQLEHFFENQPKGIPTFDEKGQQWKEVFFNASGMPQYRKQREFQIMSSVLDKLGNSGSSDLDALNMQDVFSNPKPIALLKHLLAYFSTRDDIVLDFFSGSGTTAHALMKLNAEDGGSRKFIMVQLPENLDETLKKSVGSESTTIKNALKLCDELGVSHLLTEIGKERIRRAAKQIKEEHPESNFDGGFRVFKLADSNMKDVYFSPNEYRQDSLYKMTSNIKEDRNDMDLLYGCMLEWGLPLSYPHTSEKVGSYTVHTVNNGDLMACFDENITEDIIRHIAAKKPLRVVFRDAGFTDSPAKINVGEIFKSKSSKTEVKII